MLKENKPTVFRVRYYGDAIGFGEDLEKMIGVHSLDIIEEDESKPEYTERFFHHDLFTLDRMRKEVIQDGRILSIHARRFKILDYLVSSRGRVISKDELAQAIWNNSSGQEISNVLKVHIRFIRKTLLENRREAQDPIRMVRKFGYVFE